MNYDKQNRDNNFNICIDNLIDVMEHKEWRKSNLTEFTVKYDGKAVDKNEMSADDLATSLLGLSSLLEEANSVIHGSHSQMFVKVRSSFRPGSFNVDIATFFTSDGLQALVNIIAIIGLVKGSHKSLIWLHRHTKGEPILKKDEVGENTYNITVKNCDKPMIINGDVIKLYENATIRKELGRLVYPLENKDMDEIVFLENDIECQRIGRDEKESFPPIDNEIIDEKEGIDYFLITQSNFTGKQTGWRFSKLSKKKEDFAVKILDTDFLSQVKSKDKIISNQKTIIKARYRKTTQRNERLSINWEILSVFDDDDDTQHMSNY